MKAEEIHSAIKSVVGDGNGISGIEFPAFCMYSLMQKDGASHREQLYALLSALKKLEGKTISRVGWSNKATESKNMDGICGWPVVEIQ